MSILKSLKNLSVDENLLELLFPTKVLEAFIWTKSDVNDTFLCYRVADFQPKLQKILFS